MPNLDAGGGSEIGSKEVMKREPVFKTGDRVRFTKPNTVMPDTGSTGEVVHVAHSLGHQHCRVLFDDGGKWWTPAEFLENEL